MAEQYCPFCKTRLWTETLWTPSHLHCPRCGAQFKPTVPWNYVRLLLVLVVALAMLLVYLLTEGNLLWLLFSLVVLGLIGCLWQISRIIHLHQIGPELTPSEGILDPKQLKFELDDREREASQREERRRFRRLVTLLLVLGAALVTVAVMWVFYRS